MFSKIDTLNFDAIHKSAENSIKKIKALKKNTVIYKTFVVLNSVGVMASILFGNFLFRNILLSSSLLNGVLKAVVFLLTLILCLTFYHFACNNIRNISKTRHIIEKQNDSVVSCICLMNRIYNLEKDASSLKSAA